MKLVGVLFCRCGSHKVDVNHWVDRSTAVVRCYECDTQAELTGFTLGRVYVDESTAATAEKDRAVMKWPHGVDVVAVEAAE
jgi:hypothetical protein